MGLHTLVTDESRVKFEGEVSAGNDRMDGQHVRSGPRAGCLALYALVVERQVEIDNGSPSHGTARYRARPSPPLCRGKCCSGNPASDRMAQSAVERGFVEQIPGRRKVRKAVRTWTLAASSRRRPRCGPRGNHGKPSVLDQRRAPVMGLHQPSASASTECGRVARDDGTTARGLHGSRAWIITHAKGPNAGNTRSSPTARDSCSRLRPTS